MVRAEGDPPAKGVVLCIDTRHAYAVQKLIGEVSRGHVAVAVSKDLKGRDATDEAREVIENFGGSPARWLVAVAMVSEGVDIPELRVGVWATTVRSPLRFRQGIARTLRRTGLPDEIDQTSYWFIPKDPEMVKLADETYEEVKLALIERDDDETFCPVPGADDGDDQEPLPFDAFRSAEAASPSMHAPGLGAVNPEEAARIARESGQSLGAVAAVIAAMAKLRIEPPTANVTAAATVSAAGEDVGSYPRRLKQKQGELEGLLKQFTAASLKKRGLPYSPVRFGDEISMVKREVYAQAGITDYKRADIPRLAEAIRVTKKRWAEL
jgi:hypothetical protein